MEVQKRRYYIDTPTEMIDLTDDANDNQSKRVRQSKRNIKITDLNDYCLNKLLLYLDAKDLGNIAASNTRFLAGATYVFKKLHGNKCIVFDSCVSNDKMFNNFFNILASFGDHIKKLNVTFYSENHYRGRNQAILENILEKCSKSVTELILSNVENNTIISKPFLSLQKLAINNSFFSAAMAHIVRCSPNLLCLEFYGVENVFNSDFVEQHIPLMQHFSNCNQVITDSEIENLQKFRQFVNVNSQLTSLGIGEREFEMLFRYEEIHQKFFKTIHRKTPNPNHRNRIAYLLPFEPIYFGNLKCLNLTLGHSTDFLRSLSSRGLSIDNLPLEQLGLYVDEFTIDAVHFVAQCRHLKKLQIYVCERLHLLSMATAIFNLPELDELELFLLYEEGPDRQSIPTLVNEIIKHRTLIKRIVVGFELKRSSHCTNNNYIEETVRHNEPILKQTFANVLSVDWPISCEAQTVRINNQNTQESFFLCAVLDKNFNRN